MKESKMARKGYAQGDMAPVVEDIAQPMESFPERGFSKTTAYVERQNGIQKQNDKDITKQHYKGRYS